MAGIYGVSYTPGVDTIHFYEGSILLVNFYSSVKSTPLHRNAAEVTGPLTSDCWMELPP